MPAADTPRTQGPARPRQRRTPAHGGRPGQEPAVGGPNGHRRYPAAMTPSGAR